MGGRGEGEDELCSERGIGDEPSFDEMGVDLADVELGVAVGDKREWGTPWLLVCSCRDKHLGSKY